MKPVLTIIIVYLLLGKCQVFSQDSINHSNLYIRAIANYELIRSDPEKAFIEANLICQMANKFDNHEAELISLKTICQYYTIKNDFKNLIISSQNLFKIADSKQSKVYKSIAKEYLFKAYIFNDLHQEALKHLNEGIEIINNANQSDSLVIETKANLYISMSNYYSIIHDTANQLKYIKLSIAEHDKFKSPAYKKKMKYIDYSNLSVAFHQQNTDSSDYYARKSIELGDSFELNDVKFANYIIAGNICQQKGKYHEALEFYKSAEKAEAYKNHYNREILLQNMIDIYNELNDSGKIIEYQNKLNSLKLSISESKNKSLHKIIEEKSEKAEQSPFLWIFVSFSLLFFFTLIYIALYERKKRKTNLYEKKSLEYLIEKNTLQTDSSTINLIEMVKNNDPAFLSSFHLVYPDFSKKIQSINPKIVQTEIEFCALLKLKIPTKEIAKYRNIEHRTVQNKKYIIRKKLNIPGDIDIYYWFDKT